MRHTENGSRERFLDSLLVKCRCGFRTGMLFNVDSTTGYCELGRETTC
jgi:hypothetical protein